jgi:hypothetical protein
MTEPVPSTDASAPRRLLLIAPRFFGYDLEIAEEFRRRGAQVDLLPDRPFDSALLKAATRVLPQLTRPAADRFFGDQLERFARGAYDMILVIQGESLSVRSLRRMRASFPQASVAFYTWDSLDNKPSARAKLPLYDRCLSFDPADAARYGMQTRPLFFTPDLERQYTSDFRFDISFVGTIHSDRYRVVRHIADRLPPGARAELYLYVQAPWMYWGRRLFTPTVAGSRRAEFDFEPLSKEAVRDIFFASKAILDVEHPKQRGLTMRTIETVGSGTKLVTTNKSVREYDFYNPRNICIIDRAHPRVGPEFLETPYEPVPPAVYQRYRLSQWVKDVCDD